MQQTWEITTEAELVQIVNTVLTACNNRVAEGQDSAVVVALHGDLGAGKTTFMQQFARALGVIETVVSPTFVVMKHYQLPDIVSLTDLYHLDAYRIEDLGEMAPLGFAKLLEEPHTLVAIEWAERIEALLPAHTLHLTFEIKDTKRVITLTTPDHG